MFFHPTPGGGFFDPNPLFTGTWGVHMLAVERPGYGSSDPFGPADSRTVQQMADDVAEFLNSSEGMARSVQGVNYGPVGAVGWSTGSLVAVSLAARHPDLVDKVALVDPPKGHRDVRVAALSVFLDASASQPRGAVWGRPTVLEGILDRLDGDALQEYPGLRDRLEQMVDTGLIHGGDGIETDLDALQHPRRLEHIHTVAAPTIICHSGDRKSSTGRDAHWYMRRIPNSRLFSYPKENVPTIVTAWDRILRHVAPDHGHIPESEM